jgi:hypothetical protein
MPAERILQVPFNLNAEALVENIANATRRTKTRDACLYVVHYLGRRLTTNKGRKELEKLGGVPVHVATLRKLVGRNASDAIERLEKAGVLCMTKQYATGRNSRCYLLGFQYLFQPLRDVVLTGELSERIQQAEETQLLPSMADRSIEHLLEHLAPGRLSVDMEGAHFYLETLSARLTLWCQTELVQTQNPKKQVILKKMLMNIALSVFTAKRQLLNIERDYLVGSSSRASTNLRLHTPIVGLKKQLRSFLRYRNGELIEVDMGAAQPYMLLLILSHRFWLPNKSQGASDGNQLTTSPTVSSVYPELYTKLTERSGVINTIMMYTLGDASASDAIHSYRSLFHEGDFYENLVKLVRTHPNLSIEGFKTRGQVKKTMMYLLFEDFNPVHKRRVAAYQTFKALFPHETAVMDLIKKVSSNALAILLQRLEAVLMLEQLTKVISVKYPEAGLLTVHDAILTQREYAEAVRTEMERFFHSVVGVRPAVKVSELSGHKANTDVVGDISVEVASLRRKVQRKSYQSIQALFATDDSQLLRPHIPAWEGRTASTGRVLRKLYNDPKQKAVRETLKAGLALVIQTGLTTTSYGNQPIRVQQFSIASPLSTTWRPTLTAWEIEPPLYCMTPATVKTRTHAHLTNVTWDELSLLLGHADNYFLGMELDGDELSNAAWAKLAPQLAGKAGDVGRTAADNRLFLNAVLWVLRHGGTWRILPERFGKHDTLRKRALRWAQKGTWQRLLAAIPSP